MPKKILIVVGTRPNFIKITQFEKEFKKYGGNFKYYLVHTGQHYDDSMSKVFFEQLQLKKPDFYLNIEGFSPAGQIGRIIIELEKIIEEIQPDIILVPGDVNSTLAAAIAANKTGIRLGHIESGLRSFDHSMPEEHNRLVADALSDMLFVTEESGKNNLLKEGKDKDAIHFVGNTMIDTMIAFDQQIMQSPILEKLKIKEQQFILMTMHRPANVDQKESLEKLLKIIEKITTHYAVVFPVHPRTLIRLKEFGLNKLAEKNDNLIFSTPMDYFSFQKLVACSKFVVTDSGGIQEETTFRSIPCLTLRENTERPVTIDIGSNTLVKFEAEELERKIQEIITGTYKKGGIPPMWDGKATERIVKTLQSFT